MHVIELGRDVMELNRNLAEQNKKILDGHGVFAVDILGAIGSGKTSLIEILAGKLSEFRVAAITGDVVSDLDSGRLNAAGIPSVGVNTGRECHLDAHLVKRAFDKLSLDEIDILFIENVGNLICPVDFELGSHKRITVVSVSEGDDTVEKHPMIFVTSDAAVINKIDIADAVDASPQKMRDDALKLNSRLSVFLTSIKTGEGLDDVVNWIRDAKENQVE